MILDPSTEAVQAGKEMD